MGEVRYRDRENEAKEGRKEKNKLRKKERNQGGLRWQYVNSKFLENLSIGLRLE
jgi:hypothetical protein